MDRVKVATLAVSLGGVETLIEHPASMTHAGMSPEDRRAAGFSDGLVRYSAGIEDVDDLIGDLKQALVEAEVLAWSSNARAARAARASVCVRPSGPAVRPPRRRASSSASSRQPQS